MTAGPLASSRDAAEDRRISLKRDILINASPRETRVAILEDEQLVELLTDRPDARRSVGDVFLGRVDAVHPGIQAAFVNIGTEKSAFLHASDLVAPDESAEADDDAADELPDEEGDKPSARRGARRKSVDIPPIQNGVKKGQEIVVQVTKESISTKGPRVTAQVSLAGRFLVYMPFASKVGVSRKIGDRAQRARLREQVQALLPENSGGVIVRTVSEDATPDNFKRELDTLMTQWKRITKKTKHVKAPAALHRETSLTRATSSVASGLTATRG